MAITWGEIVNSKGKLGIEVTLSNNENNITTSVTIDVYIWTRYSTKDSSNTLYFNNESSAATSALDDPVSINTTSNSSWSTSNKVKIHTYNVSYNRTKSNRTIKCAAKLTGVDYVGGAMSVTASYSIPARQSYTVKYNANGGGGAPSSQTKYYDYDLTLSSTKPTRTGYTFKGWGTTSSATTVSYSAGGTYKTNSSITLYAIWEAKTYAVTYNANSGTGAPDNQTKTYGVSLTLSSKTPSRQKYTFKGWATSSSSNTVVYNPGDSYTSNAAINLYAVWELSYKEPSVVINYYARNSAGTSVVASIGWSCDSSTTVKEIKYKYKKTTEDDSAYSDYKAINLGPGPTAIPMNIGEGNLSADSSYIITFTIVDNNNHSSDSSITVPSAFFTIDFLSGGKGVAMGKAAEKQNAFECAFDIYANSIIYDRFGKKVTNGFAEYSSDSAIDPNETTEQLILTNHANNPLGSGEFSYIITVFSGDKGTSSYRAQIAIPYDSLGSMYHRYYNGSWSDWRRHRNATNDGLTSLWSGSWSSGTIIVPNTALYKMFVVKNSAQALYIPCFKYNNNVRGGTFFTNDAGSTQYMSDFSATISGNNWTYGQATARQNTKTWASTNIKGRTITDIYGVM